MYASRIERESDSAAGTRISWQEFRDWIESQQRGSESPWIFRGQSNADWPLATAFHRHPAGRRNLIRFTAEDAPRWATALGRVAGRPYQLKEREDYAAFFSVAQHHGCPTPLLDWTKSANIAAYFAFRRHRERMTCLRCRVYAFNVTKFAELVMPQLGTFEAPHLSLYAVTASRRDHERADAQQLVFVLSNVSDIERFVEKSERLAGGRFLMKFDLPTSEARHALADLRRMGINRNSLFSPGVRSSRVARACRTLRSRFECGG